MERKIYSGECVCVDLIGKEVSNEFSGYGRVYELNDVTDILDCDFCIKKDEQWIWSIGKDLKTNKIFASTTPNFYQNDDYECLWLR